jgi:uncharacterized membrane protein YcaP (DUF421 family)
VRPFDFASLWRPELSPIEVVVRSALVYAFVQVLFRLAGRRSMARWGLPEVALLFVVGTALRKTLVGNDESVLSGFIALTTIVALDRIISAVVIRSSAAADTLEGPIVQLVHDGRLDRAAMLRSRISEDELLARVRARGHERLEEVKDAFLERSGEVTVTFK